MLATILASVIITIVPLGGSLWDTTDKCWGEVGWIYENWQIFLCEWEDFLFRKNHEIGHKIWNEYLSGEQKTSYTAIYNKHHKIGLRAFEREYWYSDVEESFCDDYASWQGKERVKITTKQRIKLISSFLK